MLDKFNSWAQSELVVMNEVRLDSGEGGGRDLYNAVKHYSGAEPHVIDINQKHEKPRAHVKTSNYIDVQRPCRVPRARRRPARVHA